MELPFEIRQMIYNFATRIRYTVNVGALMRCCKTPYQQDDALPPILSASRSIRDEAFQAYIRVNLVDLTYWTASTATTVQEYIDWRFVNGSGVQFDFGHSVRNPSIILLHNYSIPYISLASAMQVVGRCDNIGTLTIIFPIYKTFEPSRFKSCGEFVKQVAGLDSLRVLRLIARSGESRERVDKVEKVAMEMVKKLRGVGREDILVFNAHA